MPKKLDVCFFCDESPCSCLQAKKRTVKSSQPEPAPVVAPVVEPTVRTVRKITAPPPAGVQFVTRAPAPVEPVAPIVKKIESIRTDDELLEIAAIETLVAAGLVSLKDNPSITQVSLSPRERARAWTLRLSA